MIQPTRPKKGRPAKPAEARRDDRLPAPRVTCPERSQIEAAALRAGISVAEFVRRAALGLPVQARPSAATDQLIIELNRIGVNLNQITARLHHTGELPGSVAVTMAELQGVLAKVAAYDP